MQTAALSVFMDDSDVYLIRRWVPKTQDNLVPLPDGRTPFPTGPSASRVEAALMNEALWFASHCVRPDAKEISEALYGLASRIRARI